MHPYESILIILISGGLVWDCWSVFYKMKRDDGVGAISVTLVCGIIGTLVVGIFGTAAGFGQLVNQLVGVLVIGAAAFGAALLIFTLINKSMGLRVSPEQEREDLDSHEHGIRGYTITYA